MTLSVFDDRDRLEQENKELKSQIEKMKNCRNCKNYLGKWFYDDFVECKYGLPEQDCEDWELAE